jgi:hypothetical protein
MRELVTMISVVILINGYPVMARSAFRLTDNGEKKENDYQLDTGEIIKHIPSDGAVPLCKKLLDTIKENQYKKK